MRNALNFYIDGAWVAPAGSGRLAVTDPCTEAPFAYVALGDARDVERAVAAAKRAFELGGPIGERADQSISPRVLADSQLVHDVCNALVEWGLAGPCSHQRTSTEIVTERVPLAPYVNPGLL